MDKLYIQTQSLQEVHVHSNIILYLTDVHNLVLLQS